VLFAFYCAYVQKTMAEIIEIFNRLDYIFIHILIYTSYFIPAFFRILIFF
jgi:predicted membrane channel-forming protein YqfA (hemolysin III family)